jgi:tetratricopeptide (TPR) repeat protein
MMNKLGAIALGSVLLGSATAAHAEWRRFETAHFIIYSESNDKRVDELATGLEDIDGLMRLATGLSVDTEPVKVRIYEMADEGEVQAALGETGTGIAGFYSSNSLGPFAVTLRKAYRADGDFTRELVLHHEYAHHFMLQYFPATYPAWYVEGFAELIGSSKILPDGRVAYGWPAKHRGDSIGAFWVSLQDLLLNPPEKIHNFDLYGQGWAMTHFFTFSRTRAPQLRQYLTALTAGKSQAEAAKVFGDLDELNREAHAYLLQGSFEYRPVKVPLQTPVIRKVESVGAAEAALIPETIAFQDDDVKSYRKEGDREKELNRRAKVLARVEEKAARYPNDPYALDLLAEAENASGNSAKAEAALDRLLAVQPANERAMARKSILMSEAAGRLTGSARVDKASQARQLAMKANKMDPDDPLAYVAFYQSYRMAGLPVTAGALSGLIAAVEKLPRDTNVRQVLVDELAAEKRWSEAMITLGPIANDTHDSPLRQAAREQMAKLQAAAAAAGQTASSRTAN